MELPEQDHRTYHPVTLSNGLVTLLISDDKAEKAAAAVAVNVGQLQDPPLFPGLAHLVEHAVFLGSRTFPQENEYDAYLSQHGGHSNAFTDLEMTCYYCDVQVAALQGALTRFASCLACPLFQQESLEREIQAVDSEHVNHQQSDFWRLHQLARTVWGGGLLSKRNTKDNENTNTQQQESSLHPYAQFGSGNADVLLPNADTENKESRIQLLREQVVAFYERYYKASQMRCVILGNESIADLETMAEATFGTIPCVVCNNSDNNNNTKNHIPAPLPPLPHQQQKQPHVIHWIPVREGTTLEFQWLLPSQRSLYQQKPARYVSHLLGHEGPGSLLHWLRHTKHWAQELSADDVSRTTSAFSVFSLHIELTQLGYDNLTHVVQAVYAYITILQQGIPDWVHEELASTAELQFRFLSIHEPADTVSDLAVHMHYYQPQHYCSGSYKIYDYQPQLIQECVQCLTPDNANVFVGRKENVTDQVDPWYGTQYQQLEDIQEPWLQIDHKREFPELSLPERNDFLATQFDMISEPGFDQDSSQPRCLMDTETCRLWYKPDTVFHMPKVNAMFLLRTPLNSPRTAVLASLWTEFVHECCNEFSYNASMAGLHCDFNASASGVDITVSGYSHKAGVLLQRICSTIQCVPEKASVEIYNRIQTKLEQRYLGFLVAQPYQHAINAADLCLEVNKWSVQDRLECLKRLQVQDLVHFHEQLLERFHLESLIHGNVSAEQAKEWAQIVLDSFQPSVLLNRTDLRVVSLSGGVETTYPFQGWNPDDANNCVLALFQMGPLELRENAVLGLLQHIIREPAFAQLRTTEQLGYIVHTGVKTNGERVKSLMMLIQGDSFDPVHMDERIELFLIQFRRVLAEMTSQEFQVHRQAVCRAFLEANKNLMEESSKYWQVITNRTYQFTRMKDLAAHAAESTKDHVLQFFDKYFWEKSPLRRKLSVLVFGNQNELRECKNGDVEVIQNPARFARGKMLFPVQEDLGIEQFMYEGTNRTS